MRRSMRSRERVAVHRQRGQQRRVAGVAGPQLRSACGVAARGRPRAARARAGCAGGRSARCPARIASGSAACSVAERARVVRPLRADVRGRPAGAGRARPAPRADTGRCRRRRSAAGPARAARRSPRAPARRTRPAENVSVIGTKPSSRCSSRACSARARRAGQDRQALVDLQRVRRHRDRVLPALAQPLGERDRDRGLAHPGGPEHGDDEWRLRHGEPVWPRAARCSRRATRSRAPPRPAPAQAAQYRQRDHGRPHRHRPIDRSGRADGGARGRVGGVRRARRRAVRARARVRVRRHPRRRRTRCSRRCTRCWRRTA